MEFQIVGELRGAEYYFLFLGTASVDNRLRGTCAGVGGDYRHPDTGALFFGYSGGRLYNGHSTDSGDRKYADAELRTDRLLSGADI